MAKTQPTALERLIDKKCYDTLYAALSDYIEDNPDSLDLLHPSHHVEEPDEATLVDMEVISIADGASDEDTLTFDVIVSAEIEVSETVKRERESDGVTQWFKLHCEALLEEGFKDIMVTRIEIYSK